MERINRNYLFVFLISLCVFFAVFLRLYNINIQSYWLDEAYTHWAAKNSYRNLFFWVPTFESHPPFYYALVKTWNIIFGEILENPERYFSLVLSLPIIIVLLRVVAGAGFKDSKFAKLNIVILLCFSIHFSWYSIEARPYMLLVFSYSLALGGLVLIINGKNKLRYWCLFTIGSILTNWSHNLGGVLSLGLYVTIFFHFLVIDKKVFSLKKILISGFVTLLFCLPLLIMIFNQMKSWSDSTWVSEINLKNALIKLVKLYSFYIPNTDFLIGHKNSEILEKIMAFISIGFFSVLSILSIKKKNTTLAYLQFNCIFMPAVTFIITYFGPNIFLDRTLIPTLIPLYLFISISISGISMKNIKIFITSTILLITLCSTISQYENREKEPWHNIANIIKENCDNKTLILVLPNSLALPLEKNDHSNTLKESIIGLPFPYPAIEKSDFYPAGTPSVPGFAFNNISGLEEIISSAESNVFFVSRKGDLFDPLQLVRNTIKQQGWTETLLNGKSSISLYLYVPPTKSIYP